MIDFNLVVAAASSVLFMLYKYLAHRMQKSPDEDGGVVHMFGLRDAGIIFLATYASSYLASRYVPKDGPPAQAFLDSPSF